MYTSWSLVLSNQLYVNKTVNIIVLDAVLPSPILPNQPCQSCFGSRVHCAFFRSVFCLFGHLNNFASKTITYCHSYLQILGIASAPIMFAVVCQSCFGSRVHCAFFSTKFRPGVSPLRNYVVTCADCFHLLQGGLESRHCAAVPP